MPADGEIDGGGGSEEEQGREEASCCPPPRPPAMWCAVVGDVTGLGLSRMTQSRFRWREIAHRRR